MIVNSIDFIISYNIINEKMKEKEKVWGSKMDDLKVIEIMRQREVEKYKQGIKKSAELMAVINVYGRLDTKYYTGLLLNMSNINERFLETGDSSTIDNLYEVYQTTKEETSIVDAYMTLKQKIEHLRSYKIEETKMRVKRYR